MITEEILLPLLPESIYSRLAPHLPWLQWLDGAHSKNENERRSIWVWDPAEICVPPDWEYRQTQSPHGARQWSGTVQRCENPFSYMKQSLRAFKKKRNTGYSGWYGIAGYELGMSLLSVPISQQKKSGMKTGNPFWFGRYENILCYDPAQKKYFLTVHGELEKEKFFSSIDSSGAQDEAKLSGDREPNFFLFPFSLFPKEEREHYRKQVSRIREEIAQGNVYQVNYTTRFQGKTDASPQEIFNVLREKSPVPYAALWNTGQYFVFSLSPELFLKGQGKSVISRPIKGTVERSENHAEDEARKTQLLSNAKDRAELLMIVDLVRNDLGHVCVPGSVQVPELFGVESYSTVHHLVATISGELAADHDLVDAFCALFPAGSIVGAPKIAAARLIDALEIEERRFYTGAVGYFLDSGECLFNVAIRTFTLEKNLFTAYSGGGIVIDSDPEDEYRELCAKIQYLF